jgi:hypothetical protein
MIGMIILQIVVGILGGALIGALGGAALKPLKNRWTGVIRATFLVLVSWGFVIACNQKFLIMGEKYSFSNSKYIACFIMGYTVSFFWGATGVPVKETKIAFLLMMPWLFGSIGSVLLIRLVTPASVGYAIAHIFLAQAFRIGSILLITLIERKKFNWKERLFIATTYTAKSNTTATISGLFLSEAKALKLPA